MLESKGYEFSEKYTTDPIYRKNNVVLWGNIHGTWDVIIVNDPTHKLTESFEKNGRYYGLDIREAIKVAEEYFEARNY